MEPARRLAAFVFVVVTITSAAHAQTGAGLMLRPFRAERSFEGRADVLVFNQAEVADSGVGLDLTIYEAAGRYRLPGANDRRVTLGGALTMLDTSNDFIDERFVDQSVAVGLTLGTWRDWRVDATVGVGHAGTTPYADGDALYGMGDLIFTWRIDAATSMTVLVNYDGNRGIFPDVPLPAVGWTKQVGEDLRYTVGIPFASVFWRPTQRLRVTLDYTVPYSIDAYVDYALFEPLDVFAAYESRLDAFTLDGDDGDRRIFFYQQRVEAGLRWRPCDFGSVELAGGYAFDQSFERGFDVRDTDVIADLSDEPYVRAGVRFSF